MAIIKAADKLNTMASRTTTLVGAKTIRETKETGNQAPVNQIKGQIKGSEQASKDGADKPVSPENKPAAQQEIAQSATPASTKPMPDAANAAPQAPIDPAKLWKKEFEAEKFARGNVQIDDKNMGKDIGVIHADDANPVFVEHEITVPQEGKYRIELRYAAKVQRPLKLIVNGTPVLAGIARSTTRDWKPKVQAWFPVGEIADGPDLAGVGRGAGALLFLRTGGRGKRRNFSPWR